MEQEKSGCAEGSSCADSIRKFMEACKKGDINMEKIIATYCPGTRACNCAELMKKHFKKDACC